MGKANKVMNALDIHVCAEYDEDKGKYFRLLIDPVEKATHHPRRGSVPLDESLLEGTESMSRAVRQQPERFSLCAT